MQCRFFLFGGIHINKLNYIFFSALTFFSSYFPGPLNHLNRRHGCTFVRPKKEYPWFVPVKSSIDQANQYSAMEILIGNLKIAEKWKFDFPK